MSQFVFERNTETLLEYIGRDGKRYPIIENVFLVIHDQPGSKYEYTVMVIRDGEMTLGAHTEKLAIDMLKKDHLVQFMDEDGVVHDFQ